jgi:LuxR family transcriptional regulator, maltose regulon positive regulatory protein
MPNRQPSFQALEKDQTWRLGLLVAPQGSGKTRYLRLWAQQRVKRSGIPVAWLSLQPAHNRPERFWGDLCTALNAAGLSFQPTEESSISSDPPFDLEEKLIDLVNTLADRAQPLTAILDGYEAIQAAPLHQAVRLLIDNLPAQAQLVIAARTSPPLQQARLRVRRELVELGPQDLGNWIA